MFFTFLVCKRLVLVLLLVVLSNHDVGVARGTVFQEIRPGVGFETGDSAKKKLAGPPQNDSTFAIRQRAA